MTSFFVFLQVIYFGMKSPIKVILFSLTGLLLFASLFQSITHLWNFKELNGVEIPAPMPKTTLQGFCDGRFQDSTEAYLKQHFGFRQPLIRLHNQYVWDFYQTSKSNQYILALGKDGWLYEPWVVDDYYQVQFLQHAPDADKMTQQLAEEAKRIYQLQHILEPYGCHLFVCIVPSKDLIYPEHLPDHPISTLTSDKKMSARFFCEKEYERLGVNCLNLEQYFLQMKDTADFMLFPKTGTHWSRYGALLAADTLIRYMEHLGGINMKNLVIGPRTLQDAQEADTDLEGLLNLIRPLPKPQYYYAATTTDKDSTTVKPRILTIGDSFWWNVIYQIPTQEVFSSCPYWYYNSTIYYDPAYHSVSETNLTNEILSSDFSVLFYCTTQLYKMNNGFTKNALLALCYDPEEIDSVYTALKQNIYADPSWMEKLKGVAASQGKPFDEVVHNEAQWLIDNNWEKYFPALKDSIPSKRSKRASSYFEMDSITFMNLELEKTIRSIKGNETQMEQMREKSIQQGKTLEQTIHDDALWIINYKLEHGTLQIPKQEKHKQEHGEF